MASINNSNLKLILQNLRELDDICLRMSKEIEQKNTILDKGLNDCQVCIMHINKINKKYNNEKRNN